LDEAEGGDLAAIRVVADGAEALAAAVDAVAGRIGFGSTPFHLVLAGGLMRNAFYRAVTTQAVRTRLPGASPILPLADAAIGACLLALQSVRTPGLRQKPALSTPATTAAPGHVWPSEERNILTRDLDLHPTSTVVGLMHLQDRQAVSAVETTLPAIARAVDEIAGRMRWGGRLIYVGAGSSGRLAIVDAAECRPTFGIESGQIVAMIAGGSQAITHSVEGAEDDAEEGTRAIREVAAGRLDSVVGISASGRTPFVLGALAEAHERGALTIALVSNLPAAIADLADHVIAPLVGPEAIAGSTRLKAGTAQKLVLNMLSTAVLVRLGKTYGNLMVNVRAENTKLRARACRIVAEACGVDEEAAAEALAASGGEVKTAIVAILRGCALDEARRSLDQAGGVVRQAVKEAQAPNKRGNYD
jgi:N-acetylmuramic acid 6-phosphate etherase